MWVQVDPILLGIELSTGEFGNALALGGRNIVSVTLHLISRTNRARSTWLLWRGWRTEWRRASGGGRRRLITEGLGRV